MSTLTYDDIRNAHNALEELAKIHMFVKDPHTTSKLCAPLYKVLPTIKNGVIHTPSVTRLDVSIAAAATRTLDHDTWVYTDDMLGEREELIYRVFPVNPYPVMKYVDWDPELHYLAQAYDADTHEKLIMLKKSQHPIDNTILCMTMNQPNPEFRDMDPTKLWLLDEKYALKPQQ